MKEFNICFQMSKMILFNVSYYTLGSNKNPDFTTSACEFIRSKRDWGRVGQAQEDLLKSFPTAYNFYKKWDIFHLKQLTQEQYDEMRKDLDVLKQKYNNLFLEMKDGIKLKPDHFSFYQLVEFSKQTPKKITKKKNNKGEIIMELYQNKIQEWTDYERQCKIALAAVKWLDKSLRIVHGRREKNVELTYGLPYTSSGEFAAIWNTNVDARSKDDLNLQFKGMALDKDNNPVIIWYMTDCDGWKYTTMKNFKH